MGCDMRPIDGYPRYFACRDGRIWSDKTKRYLKPCTSNAGYQMVNLCVDGKSHIKTVHRLIALAFIPNPDGLEFVNHKNEVKTDNRPENLEWVTRSENVRYGTGIERRKKSYGYERMCSTAARARAALARKEG